MQSDDKGSPLSEYESALFAAVAAIVRTLPPGPHRAVLAGLLQEQRTDFLQDGKPEAAALMSLLASYAATGDA
ncbi:MAG: hypothetical protein JWQ97_4051 [Phenylobacterium sp.]|nr:hypothetical protein [Phenylobacterium sp.]